MAFSARRRLALISPKRPLWTHPKAVWAADFKTNRYARLGRARSLPALVTCSRASSHLLAAPGSAFQAFANDTLARIDGLGAYIGGQVTNADLKSQELDDLSYWNRDNSTISQNAAVAPDGTLTAEKLIGSATNTAHSVYKSTNSYASGQVYVEDIYAKAAEHSWFCLTTTGTLQVSNDKWANFNLTGNGAVGNKGSGCTAFIYKLANGWYWCGIIFTAPGAVGGGKSCVLTNNTDAASRGLSYLADGTSGVYLWGAGSTASKFQTPYVPTTASVGVRQASDVRAVDLNWFGAAGLGAGGFSVLAVVNRTHIGDGAARRIINFSDGTTNNELRLGWSSANNMTLTSIVSGAGQVSLPITTAEALGRYKVAANFIQGSWYLVDGSGNSASIGTGNAPTGLSDFRIAQDATGGGALNDVIEQLQICRPLTLAEAQAWAQAA